MAPMVLMVVIRELFTTPHPYPSASLDVAGSNLQAIHNSETLLDCLIKGVNDSNL